jgi:hypothetical protein
VLEACCRPYVMDRTKKREVKRKRRKLLRSDKLKQEQTVKRELVKLTDIVRRKYKALIQDKDKAERLFAAQAKPLVVPLQKTIVEGIRESIIPKKEVIKKEREDSDLKLEPIDTQSSKPEQTTNNQPQTVPAAIAPEVAKPTNRPSTTTVLTTPIVASAVVNEYLNKLSDRTEKTDNVYGVRADGRGNLLIGNSNIEFTDSTVRVQDKVFDITPGLLELLFMQEPNKNVVTADDLNSYKEILLLTNAHRQSYSVDKNVNSNKGKKYTSVISFLFPPKRQQLISSSSSEGQGLQAYYDVNRLVKRLRMLVMSRNAGHTGHDEEIKSIIDWLRQYKVIV